MPMIIIEPPPPGSPPAMSRLRVALDTGGNPGIIGVQVPSGASAHLQHVRVRGGAYIGVNIESGGYAKADNLDVRGSQTGVDNHGIFYGTGTKFG
jgi:hypothetical protein